MTVRKRISWFDFWNTLLILGVLVLVLYPLIYIVSASISDPILVNQGKMWLWPRGITFEGYERVFRNSEIWIGYRNTVLYTLLGTFINMLVTLPCAYALSRKDFYGRSAFMWLFVFTLFFGGGLIPTFLLVKDLGMLNTIWSIMLPGAISVWNLIICKTFFEMTIPTEIKESAEMDGCTNTGLFVRIVLPLSLPMIAVISLFYAVGHWNSYFNAMIYLSDRELFPLQLFLREILVLNQMDASMLMSGQDMETMARQAVIADIVKYAVIIVSTLPIIMIYPFLQRYFVKGVMLGSVKG